MKIFTLRNGLIAAVVVVVALNILWRIPSKPITPSLPPGTQAKNAFEDPTGETLVPSVSNLTRMGLQWKQRLATLPPEQRAQSAARLEEEKKFFIAAMQLPAEERARQVKERLEGLMNDPAIQAEWAEERYSMMAKMETSKRRQMLKSYVQSKNQYTP